MLNHSIYVLSKHITCLYQARQLNVSKIESLLFCFGALYYVYIYIRAYSVYVHPAPFVRDAIFSYLHVHHGTVAQETRLAGQKG